MGDLPSRELMQGVARGISMDPDILAVVEAWQSGRLVDREAIDYEAAIKVAIEWLAAYVGNPPAVAKAIVDAAIGDTSA